MNTNAKPVIADFAFSSGVPNGLISFSPDGTQARVNRLTNFAPGESVTLTYTPNSDASLRFKDLAGVEALAFTTPITNSVTYAFTCPTDTVGQVSNPGRFDAMFTAKANTGYQVRMYSDSAGANLAGNIEFVSNTTGTDNYIIFQVFRPAGNYWFEVREVGSTTPCQIIPITIV